MPQRSLQIASECLLAPSIRSPWDFLLYLPSFSGVRTLQNLKMRLTMMFIQTKIMTLIIIAQFKFYFQINLWEQKSKKWKEYLSKVTHPKVPLPNVQHLPLYYLLYFLILFLSYLIFRFLYPMSSISLSASIFMTVSVTVERYWAVCKPAVFKLLPFNYFRYFSARSSLHDNHAPLPIQQPICQFSLSPRHSVITVILDHFNSINAALKQLTQLM